ncbi:Ankyrin repeat family protein [Thalictrum thalictroides]|uniref:Ankyrin repeat family protein n=1 Tax=Thalictrum thalictroides TaxID=46969 RepID=A0A7J6UXS7_THATH|nr:Ankyrin repeat family protein [Thalictrum thalictroides]
MVDPMLFEAENANYVNGLPVDVMEIDPKRLLLINTSNMDPKLFEAVTTGNIDLLELLLRENIDILLQSTPMKDTAMHIAAGIGNLETVECIHRGCPKLFTKANSVGDTPLHIAARAGHLHIVSFLFNCAKDIESGREDAALDIIRTQNQEKDTIMHEAVRNCHLGIVKLLIREDPELLHMVNYAEESPLYVAVEKGALEIVLTILQKDHFSYKGPNGRTALHAAILHNNPDIAKQLLEKMPELIKEVDSNKRTALHFASTLGFLPSLQMLLKYDTSTAYFLDKSGSASIHLSAQFGRISIIMELLQCCPDLKDLVDRKRQNILHIAIEHQQVPVVRYILKDKKFMSLLNGRDKDGNTPLHQTAINSNPYMANLLVRNKNIDVMAVNRKRLTALDIAKSQSYQSTEDRKELVLATLLYFSSSRHWRFSGRVSMEMLRCGVKQRLMSIEWYKDKANTLLVVATLVATVTFAAGFTLPGGYQSDGMPTFVRQKKFEEFLWWDTMAMVFSTVAVIVLVWV